MLARVDLLELVSVVVFFFGLLGGTAVLGAFLARAPVKYTDKPRCRDCGYDLSATAPGRCCPECGGWARTTAMGNSWLVRHDGTMKLWCVVAPPILSAAAYAVFSWPPDHKFAATVFLGMLACAPISIGAAVLATRTGAGELMVLSACATTAVMMYFVWVLGSGRTSSPVEARIVLFCAPVTGAGPAGVGAGIGGLVLLFRSFRRRSADDGPAS